MAMLTQSFTHMLRKKDFDDNDLPLVAGLDFEELATPANIVKKTSLVSCQNCGAYLTDPSLIQKNDSLGTHFTCPFCEAVNVVTDDVIPTGTLTDVSVVISEAPEEKKLTITADDIFVALIDVSGSMAGAKLNAVKQSLIETINDLSSQKNPPLFCLVTFDLNVSVYFSPDSQPLTFSGQMLSDEDTLRSALLDVLNISQLQSLKNNAEQWKGFVESLRARATTALGPALLCGHTLYSLSKKKSGRLLLLTDGLANVGIGRLEGYSPNGKVFYEDFGNTCLDAGLVVDIVGLRAYQSSSDIALQTLGAMANDTGGDIYFASTEDLESVFDNLNKRQIIARDATITVLTPKHLEVLEATGFGKLGGSAEKKTLRLGALTKDRQIFLRFAQKGELESDKIPLQIQVKYRDKENREQIRIISKNIPITSNVEEFEKSYDTKVSTMMDIQQSGEHYYKSKTVMSRGILEKKREKLVEMKNKGKSVPAGVDESIQFLDHEINELTVREKELEKDMAADSTRASLGQQQSRLTMKRMMDLIK